MSEPDSNRGGLFRLSRLGWEIVIILAVKFFILYFIWLAWFSQPETRHMRLAPERVGERLLAPAPSPGAGVSETSSSEVRNASH